MIWVNGVHIQRSIYLISCPCKRKRRRWIAFERVLTRTVAVSVRLFTRFFRFQPAVNTKVSHHLVKLEIRNPGLGIWNTATAQGIRNPINDWNPEPDRVPLTKNPQSSTLNPECMAWNSESKTVSRDLFGHASRVPSWCAFQIEMTGDKSAFWVRWWWYACWMHRVTSF